MRRPTDLAVDTQRVQTSSDAYHLTQSPATTTQRLSRYSVNIISEKLDEHDESNDTKNENDGHEEETTPTEPPRNTLQPSIRLLFSQVTRRDFVLILVPAIATSMIAGGIAPFMTVVIGQAFDAFAKFPLSDPTDAERSTLRSEVGIAAVQLVALAVGAFALSSITSALWISAGERNVMRLRTKVYDAVTSRDMDWFDTKMGAEDAVVTTEGDGPVGAGGLMAKFAR
jgi:ATP-binding cassette subfamily B (MDR/TAP) protein 1